MQLRHSIAPILGLGALAALALYPIAAQAQDTVVIDTFGPGDTYSTVTGATVDGQHTTEPVVAANQFAVSGPSVNLDSITIAMQYDTSNEGANAFDLDVETSVPFSSTENTPAPSGVSLETIQVTGQMPRFGTPNAAITAASATQPLLLSGVTYWIVASLPDPDAEAAWMDETIADTTPYGLAQRNPNGGVWGYGTGHSAFRVTGLITAPEPSSTATLGLGLLSLSALAFRARKRRAA